MPPAACLCPTRKKWVATSRMPWGTKDGVLWIGEAKTGDDLDDPTSQEQLADFSNRQMSATGEPCPFVLCVPPGYEGRARQAVIDAGGSTNNLTVIA